MTHLKMMDQKKILVVDDEPIGRQLLQAVLLPEGYDVEVAENGMDAIAKMRSFLPDLVLLDVMMPGMDGYETMRKVKVDTSISHIPVIYITALDDRDSRIRGLESGANDYIAKPFDRIEILTKIKNLISKSVVEKPAVEIAPTVDKSIDNQVLNKIAAEIYNIEEHKKTFTGNINISSIGSLMTTLISGWHAKNNTTEVNCFFGPVNVNDLSGIGNILISNWLNKFLTEIPSHPSDICNYINKKIQSSELLSGDNKLWWILVFVSQPEGKWLVSGINQVLFSGKPLNSIAQITTTGNSIKLNIDSEFVINKGSACYFFHSDITKKVIEPEIINSIQQSASLDFAHEFLTGKTKSTCSFALQIVF